MEENFPEDLKGLPGLEKPDFCVKSKRAHPYFKTYFLIGFGVTWLSSIAYGFYVAFFTVTGRPKPIIDIAFILKTGFFILTGVAVLVLGLFFLFEKGGWVIGTPQRLFIYKKGILRSFFWDQFSEILLKGDSENANIHVEMKSGKMERDDNGRERYVPHRIHIFQIPNGVEVEKSMRKRIDEHHVPHSTPADDPSNN